MSPLLIYHDLILLVLDLSGQLKGRIADAISKARVGEYVRLPCQIFSEVKQLAKEFSVYWSYCNAMKCYGENIKWPWIIGMTYKGITRVNDKGRVLQLVSDSN